MAPTICMSEHTLARREKASPYLCRRRYQAQRDLGEEPSADSEQPGATQMRNSATWLPEYPSDAALPESYLKERDGVSCRERVARREGLINIVVRTISLIRRNHLLQQRVDALQSETQEFIKTVIANQSPESPSSEMSSDSASFVSSTSLEDQMFSDSEYSDDTASIASSSGFL